MSEYVAPTRIQNVAAGWEDFDKLPPDVQAEAWAQLRIEAARRVDGIERRESGLLDFPEDQPAPRPKRAWKPQPLQDPGAALDDIPTLDYVHALTGYEVHERRQSCCPLPGHEDARPSFKAYDDGGFNCFGCNRGGTIFQFAAHLWGIPLPLRGDSFREVRARLLHELGMT